MNSALLKKNKTRAAYEGFTSGLYSSPIARILAMHCLQRTFHPCMKSMHPLCGHRLYVLAHKACTPQGNVDLPPSSPSILWAPLQESQKMGKENLNSPPSKNISLAWEGNSSANGAFSICAAVVCLSRSDLSLCRGGSL